VPEHRLKTCFKCGAEKSVLDFYRHPQMADGYLGKCKECTKADVRVYWRDNAYVLRQTDGLRKRLRKQANTAVGNAIRDGRLVKAIACHYCREVKPLEAHHWNYYRPLDVMWLCVRCHEIADMARRDAEIRVEQEQTA
jgi:hypothetical protein